MKKILFLAICGLLSLAARAQYSGSGSGTESDPYLVFNPIQLAQMANFLNRTDVVFVLKNDIDLTEFIADNYPTEGWAPIGVSSTPFKGKLHGNGYTISGLTINRTSTDYVGLFGYTSGATVDNLSIEADIIKGNRYIGALAGRADSGTMQNINIKVSSSVSGFTYTGGAVGYSTGTNTNIIVDAKVTTPYTNTDYVGGIVGYLTGTLTAGTHVGGVNARNFIGGVAGQTTSATFTNCSHKGNVSGATKVGGICGEATSNATFCNCKSTGDIMSTGDYAGGILGYGGIKSATDCLQFGNITADNYAGGFLGYSSSSGTVTRCAAIGDVKTKTYAGGLMGYQSGSLAMTSSYFTGSVNGTSNVGGLIGYKSSGSIRYSYAYANVTGEEMVGGLVGQISSVTLESNVVLNAVVSATKQDVGRIYGKSASSPTIGAIGTDKANLSINNTNVVEKGVVQEVTDDLQNGTAIGQAMLKLKATYVAKGWNFSADWTLQETDSYPYLPFQAAPPSIESDLISGATSISGKSINDGTVHLYYKNTAEQTVGCDATHNWTFTTPALQSGAEVRLYVEAEGLAPSYFTTQRIAFPGKGTETDPYRIYTAEDLQGVSKMGYYKMMNDIDLTAWIKENSPTKGWISVGRNGVEGTYFDGDGHKVSGLWTNTTDDYTGLFSNFSRGSIKNLTVEVASGKKVKGGNYTGILIGRNANGTIRNVIVKGDVQGTQYVGGVMGYSASNAINTVTYEGAVSSTTASARLGGIAGEATSNTVTSCRLDVTITSSGNTAYVGSAFGIATGTMTKTLANCNITATGTGNRVGGLMGNGSMSINQSLTTGVVKATGTGSYAGGLVGYATGSLTDCYSTATTTGTDYTAGLVAYTTSSINKCYAKGDATGVLNGAGVVAQLDGASAKVQNSVAANNQLTFTDQSSWASRVIGGYKNGAADPDNSNYALKTMQVTLNGVATKKSDDLVEGIAKEQSELRTSAFYESLGWDMTNTWAIDEGQMYPYLLWEVDINPVVEITFDKSTAVVAAGNTLTLTPSIQPLGATNKRLTWTSSNEDVATVEDGVVTAVSVGEATITATSTDGSNISATCKVTVVANHDEAIAELRDLVDNALALYNGSSEGSEIGQYAAGSRADLLKVINEVRALISDTMDETSISDCSAKINAAVADFKAQRVTGGDDTDITLLDNVVYIEPVESGSGKQLTLSVKMKNSIEFTGFQFDLYLPERFTFATDEDDFLLTDLSLERTTVKKTDYFNASVQPDGAVRALCYSSKGYAFEGQDGEIATVTINIPADIEAGDYPLIIKASKLSTVLGATYTTDYVKTTLTVSNFTPGDANDDGSIDVGDLTAIASHILGTTPPNFVPAAADANADSDISVGDLTLIAYWILHGTPANSNHRVAQKVATTTGLDAVALTIGMDAFSVAPGETVLVPVSIQNPFTDFAGFQFDVTLPEGLHVVDAALSTSRTTARKADFFSANTIAGVTRVLCYSSTNTAFDGTDGAVALLTIAADESLTTGLYTAELTNAKTALCGLTLTPQCAPSTIAVVGTTGANSVTAGSCGAKVYELNGRVLMGKPLQKGVYISGGHKIVK